MWQQGGRYRKQKSIQKDGCSGKNLPDEKLRGTKRMFSGKNNIKWARK